MQPGGTEGLGFVPVEVSDSHGMRSSGKTDVDGNFAIRIDTAAPSVWYSVRPEGYEPLQRQVIIHDATATSGTVTMEARFGLMPASLAAGTIPRADGAGTESGTLLEFQVKNDAPTTITVSDLRIEGTIGVDGVACANPPQPYYFRVSSTVQVKSFQPGVPTVGTVPVQVTPDAVPNLVRRASLNVRAKSTRCGGGDYALLVTGPQIPIEKNSSRAIQVWFPATFLFSPIDGGARPRLALAACMPGSECKDALHVWLHTTGGGTFAAPTVMTRTRVLDLP
jgi:hypothetical protein